MKLAEVIKLAREYDPEGKRTLGVVTKCDDAARAESTDVVEKVLMQRESDVKLTLGFHCVVRINSLFHHSSFKEYASFRSRMSFDAR